MSWVDTYNQKRLSVEEAAAKIESGDRVYVSPCTATPVQLLEALAGRVGELRNVDVVSGLLMHPFKILQSPEYAGRIDPGKLNQLRAGHTPRPLPICA